MKLEKDLWKMLKKHLPKEAERVENIVGEGFPDVMIPYEGGRVVFLELKRSSRALRTEENILKTLRPSQKAWHFKRARIGCICFVVSLCPLGLSVWRLKAGEKGITASFVSSFLLPTEVASIISNSCLDRGNP